MRLASFASCDSQAKRERDESEKIAEMLRLLHCPKTERDATAPSTFSDIARQSAPAALKDQVAPI
jgi:hypothetical protein